MMTLRAMAARTAPAKIRSGRSAAISWLSMLRTAPLMLTASWLLTAPWLLTASVLLAGGVASAQQLDPPIDARVRANEAGAASQKRVEGIANETDALIAQFRLTNKKIESLQIFNRSARSRSSTFPERGARPASSVRSTASRRSAAR